MKLYYVYFCQSNLKNVIFVTVTWNSEMYRSDHYVGSGSCHNGCILNVFDQVVHCVDPFFSLGILCDRICFRLEDWTKGSGGRFCFSIVEDVFAWETDGTGSPYIRVISVLQILQWHSSRLKEEAKKPLRKILQLLCPFFNWHVTSNFRNYIRYFAIPLCQSVAIWMQRSVWLYDQFKNVASKARSERRRL